MDVKYKGMTVNERLWVSGLMDKYKKAVKEKDVDTAIAVLVEVELTDANINPILISDGLVRK